MEKPLIRGLPHKQRERYERLAEILNGIGSWQKANVPPPVDYVPGSVQEGTEWQTIGNFARLEVQQLISDYDGAVRSANSFISQVDAENIRLKAELKELQQRFDEVTKPG